MIVTICHKNMLKYLSADIICSKKQTELCERKAQGKLWATRSRYNVQGQISEHIFDLNGGYCLYYPLNLFRNACSYENWGIYNNYSMSPNWIWSDKITNEHVARVGYSQFISNKGSWNNCFSKFSNQVLFPQFYKVSGKSIQLLVTCARLPPSLEYYITKSWMKVTATQTTICRQLVAKTKLKLFNRSNTR